MYRRHTDFREFGVEGEPVADSPSLTWAEPFEVDGITVFCAGVGAVCGVVLGVWSDGDGAMGDDIGAFADFALWTPYFASEGEGKAAVGTTV